MKTFLTHNEQLFESMIEITDLGAALEKPVIELFCAGERKRAFELLVGLHPIYTPGTYPLTYDAWCQLMVDKCRAQGLNCLQTVTVTVTPHEGAQSYHFYRKIGE